MDGVLVKPEGTLMRRGGLSQPLHTPVGLIVVLWGGGHIGLSTHAIGPGLFCWMPRNTALAADHVHRLMCKGMSKWQ